MYDEKVREALATCLKHTGCNDRSIINDTIVSVNGERSFDSITSALDDTWSHWFEENYNNPYNEIRPEILRPRGHDEALKAKRDDSQFTEFSLMIASFSME